MEFEIFIFCSKISITISEIVLCCDCRAPNKKTLNLLIFEWSVLNYIFIQAWLSHTYIVLSWEFKVITLAQGSVSKIIAPKANVIQM